jgi:hypothetical protein
MRHLPCLILLAIGLSAPIAFGAEAKADADPLAAFTDEQLMDPGFCFQKFVEALGAKNAPLAQALINETPKGLRPVDFKKEADRTRFLDYFGQFKGASIVKLERMAITRQSVVTYTDAKGATKTVRMEMQAGKWKIIID